MRPEAKPKTPIRRSPHRGRELIISPLRRILLADDSEDNRLLIAAYLRNTPHQLETAENGLVAVEMFKHRRYDLVLLDLNMPVMGGYATAMAMRAWEREQGSQPNADSRAHGQSDGGGSDAVDRGRLQRPS